MYVIYFSLSNRLFTSIVVLPRYKGSRCSKASFECRRASVCIPREWKCNGHVDCSDTDVSDVSDELNCGTWRL